MWGGGGDPNREVTVNWLLARLPPLPLLRLLSSIIPTARPLSLTAYGGSGAAPASSQESTLLDVMQQIKLDICSSYLNKTAQSAARLQFQQPSPLPPPAKVFPSNRDGFFQAGEPCPPRVQSAHRRPAPAPFAQLTWRDDGVIPPSSGTRGVRPQSPFHHACGYE